MNKDGIKGGQGREDEAVRFAGLVFLLPIILGIAIAITFEVLTSEVEDA